MLDDEFSVSSEFFDVGLKTRILSVLPPNFENRETKVSDVNSTTPATDTIKIRPATALPYASNKETRPNNRSNLKTNFLNDLDDKKDTESLVTEEHKARIEERKRNYLDYITNSILCKKAFNFATNELTKEKTYSRPASGVSRISFSSVKTHETKISNKSSRPNSVIKSDTNINRQYNNSSAKKKNNKLETDNEYSDMTTSTYTLFPFPIHDKKIIVTKKLNKTEEKMSTLDESRMKFLNELSQTSSLIETKIEDEGKTNQTIQSSFESFSSFNIFENESDANKGIKKKKKKKTTSRRLQAQSAKAKLQTSRNNILQINETTYKLNTLVIIN